MKLTYAIMYKACVEKDATFEGQFITAVKTTGIFCRPICTARKPKFENVAFYKTTDEAIKNGFRACKVCKPLENSGKTPAYINQLINELDNDSSLKIKDADLLQRALEPHTVRRWFLKNHQMTFHSFQRMYRINSAFKKIQRGESIISVAFDTGYESLSGFNDSYKSILGKAPSKSKQTKIINITRLETPIGVMIACAVEEGICLLQFADSKTLEKELKILSKKLSANIIQGQNKHLDLLKNEIVEYFDAKRQTFSVKLFFEGTQFQQAVWKELETISFGTTRTLLQQASNMNKEKSYRAIANAINANKILLLLPNHRLIIDDKSLLDFNGGEQRKNWLLAFEENLFLAKN